MGESGPDRDCRLGTRVLHCWLDCGCEHPFYLAPTLSRYPTEYQWLELEDQLRRTISGMARQTLPEALGEEPAKTVIEEWRHRHWLDESARYLP